MQQIILVYFLLQKPEDRHILSFNGKSWNLSKYVKALKMLLEDENYEVIGTSVVIIFK